jgi:UDP-2,3-diacylglucosamine pyrophosphatase LpxH
VVRNVHVSYLIGTLLYLQMQKWDSKNKTVTRFLDRMGTRWQRLSEKVAHGALAHARHHQAARIFCGHTHAALHKQEHGIDYFNCGAWIDEHPTYITVGEEGVQIHEYVDETDQHHPATDKNEERRWDDSELAEFAGDEGRLEDGECEPVGL